MAIAAMPSACAGLVCVALELLGMMEPVATGHPRTGVVDISSAEYGKCSLEGTVVVCVSRLSASFLLRVGLGVG